MKLALLSYKNVDFVWSSVHHGAPLKGICRFEDQLCRFERNDWGRYAVYPLTLNEKLYWLWHKWLYELCIGRHQSGNSPEPRRQRRPAGLWKLIEHAYNQISPVSND